MTCDECIEMDLWSCERCTQPETLNTRNKKAWIAWNVCHKIGRDYQTTGMILTAVIAELDAIGGTNRDIDRVLELERIFREKNQDHGRRN